MLTFLGTRVSKQEVHHGRPRDRSGLLHDFYDLEATLCFYQVCDDVYGVASLFMLLTCFHTTPLLLADNSKELGRNLWPNFIW